MADLDFQDNNAIPGMAHMAERFLQVIKQRSDEEQIGLDFHPRQDKQTKEIFLEATVKFRSFGGGGYPIRIRVHSTPRGKLLHVGYAVVTDSMSGWQASLGRGNALEDVRAHNVNMRPENQRQLMILLDSFAQAVYGPTVSDLINAAEANRRPQGGSGFLGNQ